MAVMAQDGVAVQQKALPVSDQMTLDLDINANSNHDDATLDLDATVSKVVEISPPNDFTSTRGGLNGSDNVDTFTSNQTIVATSALPSESQATENASSTSLENQTSSQLHDTNTTTSVDQRSSIEVQNTSILSLNEPEPEILPAIESATETVIASALQDTAATSTVLPVIERQESDLRDTTSPLALAPQTQPESQQATEPPEPNTSNAVMDGAFENTEGSGVTSDLTQASLTSDPLATNTATLSIDGQSTSAVPEVNDSEMADVPESAPFAKVAREREDDDDDEPTAKRTKLEEDSVMTDAPTQEFRAPEAPTTVADKTVLPTSADSAVTPISPYEVREITKILRNVARSKDGKNFKSPVENLWPQIAEQYRVKISHPVDLTGMENSLREQKYASVDEFKADVNLIAENALTFNGEGHDVTKAALSVRDAILSKIANLPPESVAIPKPPKKQVRQSTPRAENAPRTTPTRRQSKSAGSAPVIGAPPAPTFALDPKTNTPLIRRDSTKNDAGRPKREIHPPKNKDLPYATTRPKNKKLGTELKFVDHVLAELKKPKHAQYSHAFMLPVDPVSLSIPTYFQVIKHPMDIQKIEEKLREGQYQSAKGVEADIKLMFANCYKFNPAENMVHTWGKQFEAVFNEVWGTKNQWIADHAPAAQTPSTNGGSDEEESEEEEEIEDPATGPNAIAALSERLNEEQEKLIILMSAKVKDQQMIDMQKDMIDLIKGKIATAKAKPPPKKVVKKPKTARAPKKQAVAKKSGTTKKAASKRDKYMGTHEKNVISIGIQRLPEDVIKDVLAMIKAETDVDEGDDGEVELDIDVVTPPTLWKIYNLVMQYVPEVDQEAKSLLDKEEDAPRATPAKPPQKKKNKPMSKVEQERKIELLQNSLETFDRQGSGSQEPVPTVENAGNETSGDEDDESEEDD